jgi:hypothetical protein
MPFQKKNKEDTTIAGVTFRKNELSRIIADINTPPAIKYKCTLLLHRLCSTGEEKQFYTAMVLGEVIKKPQRSEGDTSSDEEPSLTKAVEKMMGYTGS